MDYDEANNLKLFLKIMTENAIKKTYALGRPITTVQDGYIVRKYADGRIEKVKRLEKLPVCP